MPPSVKNLSQVFCRIKELEVRITCVVGMREGYATGDAEASAFLGLPALVDRTVIPWLSEGWVPEPPADTGICRCSSSLYKTV